MLSSAFTLAGAEMGKVKLEAWLIAALIGVTFILIGTTFWGWFH